MSEDPEFDDNFPLRSGPPFLAGVVAFVAVNLLVYFVTGKVGVALASAFALWLVAVAVVRRFDR